MCTKILTLFLIPLLILGNSFARVPCAAAHSSQDDNRTHFHIGFGSYHGHDDHEHNHDHGSHSHGDHDHDRPEDKPDDHDSDAIYLVVPDGEFATPNCVTIDFEAAAVFGHSAACFSKPQVFLNRDVETFNRCHGPPLYLLHCAIRI
ncbi:MAG: hypothetical protein ACK5YR_04755 [Pirellula sp.]|jgi:hypothetical protein